MENPYNIPVKKNFDTQKLNWFWNVTSDWRFYPLLYGFLAIVISVIACLLRSSFREFFQIFFIVLIFMPSGIVFLAELIKNFAEEAIALVFPLVFHIVAIASLITIHYYKTRKNKILKWLIISLLLIILLAFLGCSVGVILKKGDFSL